MRLSCGRTPSLVCLYRTDTCNGNRLEEERCSKRNDLHIVLMEATMWWHFLARCCWTRAVGIENNEGVCTAIFYSVNCKYSNTRTDCGIRSATDERGGSMVDPISEVAHNKHSLDMIRTYILRGIFCVCDNYLRER